jgi:hypothetical protein
VRRAVDPAVEPSHRYIPRRRARAPEGHLRDQPRGQTGGEGMTYLDRLRALKSEKGPPPHKGLEISEKGVLRAPSKLT